MARESRLEVHQILLSRGKPRDLALTRDHLYTTDTGDIAHDRNEEKGPIST